MAPPSAAHQYPKLGPEYPAPAGDDGCSVSLGRDPPGDFGLSFPSPLGQDCAESTPGSSRHRWRPAAGKGPRPSGAGDSNRAAPTLELTDAALYVPVLNVNLLQRNLAKPSLARPSKVEQVLPRRPDSSESNSRPSWSDRLSSFSSRDKFADGGILRILWDWGLEVQRAFTRVSATRDVTTDFV